MLLKPLFENAANRPGDVAIVDDRGQLTFGQLAAASAGLAAHLSAATSRDAVGVLLPSSGAFAVAFYAGLIAGKTVVPVNFLLGPAQVAHVIADSGVDLVLSAPPLAEKLAPLAASGLRVLDLSTLPAPTGAAKPQSGSHAASTDDGAVAVMLYTSGTSGMPKGVPLTHRNLGTCVDACIERAQLKGEHTFLGLVPLFHSLGLTASLLAPMRLGTRTTYLARFSPMGVIEKLRQHRPSIVFGIPSMFRALLSVKSAGPEDFAGTYAVICGGEPLPGTLREAFEQRFGVPLREGYGLSETCGPIAVNVPGVERPGSVGRPLGGVVVRTVDDTGADVPAGEVGEVLLGGPMIFGGYHHLPDATAEARSPDGLFKTGDLGKLDADGFLHITGRAKDLIIVAGEKLYPREVEELLLAHPAIADAAVVGKKDESRGEAVAAFVVAREGRTVDANEVRAYLRDAGLPGWKLPRDVTVLDELPRSPTGKVLKRELAARE